MFNSVISGFAERSNLRCVTTNIPTLEVVDVTTGESLFFVQDEEAGNMIDEAEQTAEVFDVSVDDAICFTLDSAGIFA